MIFDFGHMNYFDYFIIVIVGISAIMGFARGLVQEIIALLTWIMAFFVAIVFANDVSVYLAQFVKFQIAARILAFLFLFFTTWIIGVAVNMLFSRLASTPGLSIWNHLFGTFFGIARGFVIIAVIIFLVFNTSWKESNWFKNSLYAPKFYGLSSWLNDHMFRQVQQQVQGHIQTIQKTYTDAVNSSGDLLGK